MTSPHRRAVVIGAGLAGLAAAAALRSAGLDVVVLERDALPTAPEARRGVPQGDHLHNLLTRAQRHLEDLLPGFGEALRERAAVSANVSLDTYVFELGVVMPRRDLGLQLVTAPRPTIDYVARELLAKDPGVTIVGEETVTGLAATTGGLVGVTTGPRRPRTIEARWVVDASGAGTQAQRWLVDLGSTAPPIVREDRGQWYATARFERPANAVGTPTFVLLFPTPPQTRGALLSPLGPRQWLVSVNGRRPDPVPRTLSAFRTHLDGLEDPTIAEMVANARCVEGPRSFQRVAASWRRYELLDPPLAGFLPLGDALASLNPLYGQGMSIAAWQAHRLRTLLLESGPADGRAEVTSRYLDAAAATVRWAWDLGALVDQAFARQPDAAARISEDPEFHHRYVSVWHLLEPASSLASIRGG